MDGNLEVMQVFELEARELIETLEQTLLDLETRPDSEDLIALAFRSLHTLKGSGAMFGFTDLAAFLHEFETAFDRIRNGTARVSVSLVKAALQAADYAKCLIEGRVDPRQGVLILAALEDAMRSGPVAAPLEQAQSWEIRFRIADGALALGANPLLMLDEIRSLGACVIKVNTDSLPALETIDPHQCYIEWTVILSGSVVREAIDDVFMFVRDDMDLAIEQLTSSGEDRQEAVKALTSDATIAAEPSSDRPERASTIRVPASRLDELMDRVGELVIAQTRLTQLAETLGISALTGVSEDIARLTGGLRDTTMATRVVPIGTLFGRFRRLVHDLSSELGKHIDFVTEGEDTELDKTMTEQLADPLIHLIRNAIDHGLEKPEIRVSSGKSETGRIRLSASHRGAEVAITISDDGAGLDTEAIRSKAVKSGLIAADTIMDDADIHRLIFEPGFSTAASVTSLSGRGVGMDVVKRTIDGLRGSIDVATLEGQGTSVTLRLPLTLAIIDGLLVRVGDDRYTIPLAAVEECLELPGEINGDARGRSFLNLRGDLVPFLRLRDLFLATTEADQYQKVVVVASGKTRVGLVVDEIIGNNQTVIKQLSKLHSKITMFSGSTILGDGTVALILDIMHLVDFGQTLEEQGRMRTQIGRAA